MSARGGGSRKNSERTGEELGKTRHHFRSLARARDKRRGKGKRHTMSREVCKYYLHGACRNGTSCRFAHSADAPKSNVCTFYLQGNCSYGDRCRYDHVRPKARPPARPRPCESPCDVASQSFASHERARSAVKGRRSYDESPSGSLRRRLLLAYKHREGGMGVLYCYSTVETTNRRPRPTRFTRTRTLAD